MLKNVIKKLSNVPSANYVGKLITQAGGAVEKPLLFIMKISSHTGKNGNYVSVADRRINELSILRRWSRC